MMWALIGLSVAMVVAALLIRQGLDGIARGLFAVSRDVENVAKKLRD